MNRFSAEAVLSLMNSEMKKCYAPITGFLVVCGLMTEKSIYLGHNYEKENPVAFKHAETNALAQVFMSEHNPRIESILMLGGGKVSKLKYITPCYSCTQVLTKFVPPSTFIKLKIITNNNKEVIIAFDELISAYIDPLYSLIEKTDPRELHEELSTKTALKGNDIDFVAALRLLGIKIGVNFYLTGSSSGRGGVSTLLMKKTQSDYYDIDIIAVVKEKLVEAEQEIEALIIKFYGIFRKEKRIIPSYKNKKNVLKAQYFYYCGSKKERLVDITFSTNFKYSFTYKEYQLKNWFHQLS